MDEQLCFRGSDGMDRKIRVIANRCSAATRGMSRTLLLAVSAPDPVSTPDCEHAEARGFWVHQLDTKITVKSMAEMLGSMQGLIDMLENDLTLEFGEEVRELIDDARGRSHTIRMNMVATEPIQAR